MQLESGFIINTTYSAWQKKNVRTIQVGAQSKSGQNRSISAALSIAQPYDRIELSGGEYPEALSLTFPVEIAGSDGEEPVIISRNAGITVTGNVEVYLENISVVSRSTASKVDAAFVATAGSPLARRCKFSSVLLGGLAFATLEDCTVTDSASGFGLVVQDEAGGLVTSSTIRDHARCAVDIDTRGELTLSECTLSNVGADVVTISGAHSATSHTSSSGRGGHEFLSSSGVTVSKCRIYVDRPTGKPALGPLANEAVSNASGCACCLIIRNGGAPTCETNEMMEGEVGVLLDGAGPAQLRGNIIRAQRRCGILALLEDGTAAATAAGSAVRGLCISDENVLERCYIGIDVQCRGNSRAIFGTAPDQPQSDALPTPKRAFHWLTASSSGSNATAKPVDEKVMSFSETAMATKLAFDEEWITAAALKAHVAALVSMTVRAHPTCAQPSFCVVSGGMGLPITGGSGTAGSNTLTSFVAATLGANFGTAGAARKADAAAVTAMLSLRGRYGVDIVRTRFLDCGLCAVRFGRQSYGLVEDCAFEDCGTHAVMVDSAAHPLITGCHFSRSRGSSILLTNHANALIVGNEITAGQSHGIEMCQRSRGLVAGNLIAGNRGSGVFVCDESLPLISGNFIVQNRSGGVRATDAGRPIVLANHFSSNAVASVVCTESSDVFVALNKVYSCVEAGVLFTNCSRGTVICNDISSNGDGLVLELDADPFVYGNTIQDNIRAGVLARNNALGSIVGNRITRNSGPNIMVTDGAEPQVRDNHISHSGSGGVVVCGEGKGWFEKNDISENEVANVLVVGAYSDPEFRRNKIHSSLSGCGVVCSSNSAGTFTDNSIYGNRQAGVYVFHGAQPKFLKNRLSREVIGVLASNGGRGHFEDNAIHDCLGHGVITQLGGDPTFQSNRILDNTLSGVLVAPDGCGSFLGNTLTGNDIGVQLGSSMAAAQLDLNSAYLTAAGQPDGGGGGVALTAPLPALSCLASINGISGDRRPMSHGRASPLQPPSGRHHSYFAPVTVGRSALQDIAAAAGRRRSSTARAPSGQFRGNAITGNRHGGILLDYHCSGLVEDNDITANGDYGVRANVEYADGRALRIAQELAGAAGGGTVAAGASAVFLRMPGYRNSSSMAALAAPGAAARLVKNRIHSHRKANIVFESFQETSGMASLVENDIHTAPKGIFATNASVAAHVEGNHVHHCLDGMYFDASSRGLLFRNRISECTYCGVYVSDHADPTFSEENTVELCGICGVLVDAMARGSFDGGVIRRCGLAGVVVFTGAATPFSVSYEQAFQAEITSAAPSFKGNRIEENETHGVLALSVISGCPLRTPLTDAECYQADGRQQLPFEPMHATTGSGAMVRGEQLSACFAKNTISGNRLFGVFHDRFEHWDFEGIFAAVTPRKNMSKGKSSHVSDPRDDSIGHSSRSQLSPPATDRRRRATVKNAYGGYEILLGTSMVGDSAQHLRQRELKQLTFRENDIGHSCIGVAAGYGCHPFLVANTIHHNAFFGLLLRFGSAVMAHACTVTDNGLAGVHAVSGAKGFISAGAIKENNALCRPEGSPHQSRQLADVFPSTGGATTSYREALATLGLTDVADLAPDAAAAAKGATRQLSELADVHVFTLTEGIRTLWEIVCASSAAPHLASGCTPSGDTPVGGDARADNAGLALSGVCVPGLVPLCVADGGIGAWIEEGSRVCLSRNAIEGHRHAGVYFSTGVAKQHRVLHSHFSMNDDKDPATTSAGSGGGRTGFNGQARVKPTLAEDMDAAVSSPHTHQPPRRFTTAAELFALPAVRPPLANDSTLAVFSPRGLCAGGVMATVQLLSTSATPLVASLVVATRPATIDGRAVERIDSIHCAHLIGNSIARNAGFGVFLEPTQSIRATPGGTAADATGPHAAAQRRSSTPAAPTLSATDSALLSAGEEDLHSEDFHVVVQDNTIACNGRAGVYCQPVVEIRAGACVPTRSALHEWVEAALLEVQSVLALKRAPSLPHRGAASHSDFALAPVAAKTNRVLVISNDISGNGGSQAEVSSRYVVCAGDTSRTLLQFDTMAPASATSRFRSHSLLYIPIFAALLACPPPGLCLFEGNTIHEGANGLLVCGLVGSSSLRLRCNHFKAIAQDAVCIRGHLAACTVGSRNTFRDCGVGVRLSADTTLWRPSGPEAGPEAKPRNDLRSRVFGNRFISSRECSVVTDGARGEPILLYSNEFRQHTADSVAVFLTHHSRSGSLVLANIFSDSYTPLVVAGGGSDSSGSSDVAGLSATGVMGSSATQLAESLCSGHTDSSAHAFLDNVFARNYIGVVVCSGARPIFTHNLFDNNSHAGLEISGAGTRPVVDGCVFQNHRRRPSATAAADAAFGAPPNGKLVLMSGALTVDLLPGNSRILSPNSQLCLPTGILLGPAAECEIHGCYFAGNDIGVDAARDHAGTATFSASDLTAAIVRDCVFHDSRVAGVLARSSGGGSDGGGGGGSAAARPAAQRTAKAAMLKLAKGTEVALSDFAAVVKGCFFIANKTSEDLCGDVVATTEGYVAFHENVFYGTVHCLAASVALFSGNTFASANPADSAEEGPATAALADSAHSPPILTLEPALAAVILHEGAQATVEDSAIAHRRRGLLACPAANGDARRNTFICCTTAIVAAPFCNSKISENKILRGRDCGILAFGGLLTANQVVDCPTGIVLQPPAQYAGFNAIPSHKRDSGNSPLCIKNHVTACADDGILVAGVAQVEGNVVCKCGTGVHIVTPSSAEALAALSGVAGVSAAAPLIFANAVYDCGMGLILAGNAVATIRDNDIFDNAAIGVEVAGSATGALQNNSISTPNEQGAVDIPSESRVKVTGNAIRNQFSPAYNRATRTDRMKEYAARQEAVTKEVGTVAGTVAATAVRASYLDAQLSTLGAAIATRLGAANDTMVRSGESAAGTAGSPARALRRHSSDNEATSHGHSSFSSVHSPTQPPSGRAHPASEPRRSTAQAIGRGSVASRALTAARRTSTAASQKKADGGVAADKGPKQVLIHVFPRPHVANAHSAALALGEAVGRLLASPPMSKMKLATTITTSTSQLSELLAAAGKDAKHPEVLLTIVVIDSGESTATAQGGAQALHLLTSAAEATAASSSQHRRRGGCGANLVYLVHPDTLVIGSAEPLGDSLFRASPAPHNSEELDALAAAATSTLTFHSGVEDALEPLRQLLVNDLIDGGRSLNASTGPSVAPPPPTRPRGSVTSFPRRSASGSPPPAVRRQSKNGSSGSKDVLPYTREQVSDILSKLTPAAFGNAPASSSAAPKRRRKTSVISARMTDTSDQSTSSCPNPGESKRGRKVSVVGVPGAIEATRRSSLPSLLPGASPDVVPRRGSKLNVAK